MAILTPHDRARLMVLVAALLWSTSGFFAKAPWFVDWPIEIRGVSLAFWRAVFAAIAVLPFVRRPVFRVAMVPMSFSFVAMTYSFLAAMVGGSETTTIWLQYIAPVWVAIAGLIGLGDRPGRSDWVMVGLAMTGIAFIVSMESRYSAQSLLTGPVGLALFSGLMYAFVVLSIRRLRGVDAAWLGLVNQIACIVVLLPFIVGKTPLPHGIQWPALAALGILQLGLPYILFAWAVREVESHEASLITLVEPLAVPLWTFIAWRHLDSYQFPRWWTLIGAGLIFAGFLWRYGISYGIKRRAVARQGSSSAGDGDGSDSA